MQGHKQEKAYVAAQAPMPHSVNHFWSIIFWDMDIHSVVVLADFEENGKVSNSAHPSLVPYTVQCTLGNAYYCDYWSF